MNGVEASGQRGERAVSNSQLVGATCGPYSIVALLGAGGMGEVWRAEDTRLGRQVALKMLPEELADDPERLARFEREAKVLGSLNHSNIAVLYGLEHLTLRVPPVADDAGPLGDDAAPPEDRDVVALVMELVEGEGLDEMIARGPLSVGEAMPMALQIAQALHAAHERGIVHRDLKPANIRVRPDGTVKVLDFGLATSRHPATGDGGASLAPTLSGHRTTVGMVVGTASYMSPEQARGQPVDRRGDIWGFGCLLFEMLTGAKAFEGETLSDTVATLLKDDPPWEALPRDVNAVTRHVLRRCLAKDPSRRFHDIADVRIELEEARAVGETAVWRPSARRVGMVGRRLAVAGAVGLALLAVILAFRAHPRGDLPTFRALTFRSGHVASARFGPDDRTVVFAMATRDRPLSLWSTRSDSVESTQLAVGSGDILGISDHGRMAVLLDRRRQGSWVSVGTLALAELAGGAVRPVLEKVNDGDISPDGERLAVVREKGGMQRLEYPLGRPLFETRGWISHVRIAPDGERVAFLHHPHYGDDRGLVAMVEGDGSLRRLTKELPDSVQGVAWAPDGSSVWFSAHEFGKGGVVWSVRPGEAPVERLRSPVNLRIQDVVADGRALVAAGDSRAEIAGRLAGASEDVHFEGWNDDSIGGLAADGSAFAGNVQVSTVDGEYAAFVRRADGSPPVKVGFGDVLGMSPRGDWVFTRAMTEASGRLTLLPTGPGEPRMLDLGGVSPVSSGAGMVTSSLDGRRAAFLGTEDGEPPRIHVVDLPDGPTRVVGPPGTGTAVLSPDGDRVVALSPDGAATLYEVAGGTGRQVPGVRHDEVPVQWSPDGRAILVWDRTFPARIERVDVVDGRRELAALIMPEDNAGVLYGQILLAPGADFYVYRYRRSFTTLFLVEGIR